MGLPTSSSAGARTTRLRASSSTLRDRGPDPGRGPVVWAERAVAERLQHLDELVLLVVGERLEDEDGTVALDRRAARLHDAPGVALDVDLDERDALAAGEHLVERQRVDGAVAGGGLDTGHARVGDRLVLGPGVPLRDVDVDPPPGLVDRRVDRRRAIGEAVVLEVADEARVRDGVRLDRDDAVGAALEAEEDAVVA